MHIVAQGARIVGLDWKWIFKKNDKYRTDD